MEAKWPPPVLSLAGEGAGLVKYRFQVGRRNNKFVQEFSENQNLNIPLVGSSDFSICQNVFGEVEGELPNLDAYFSLK